MPIKKIMDPSKSKSDITSDTISETNNRKNPSSRNKNILITINAESNAKSTGSNSTKMNNNNNKNKNRIKSAKNNTTAVATETKNAVLNHAVKINKPKLQMKQNGAANLNNALKVKKMQKQENLPVGEDSLPVLDADGLPKLSRRLKIQNKIEKQKLKALAEGTGSAVERSVLPTSLQQSTVSPATSAGTTTTTTLNKNHDSPCTSKTNSNSHFNSDSDKGSNGQNNVNSNDNRPPGANKVEGPNSGKKWVRKEQDVSVSSPPSSPIETTTAEVAIARVDGSIGKLN